MKVERMLKRKESVESGVAGRPFALCSSLHHHSPPKMAEGSPRPVGAPCLLLPSTSISRNSLVAYFPCKRNIHSFRPILCDCFSILNRYCFPGRRASGPARSCSSPRAASWSPRAASSAGGGTTARLPPLPRSAPRRAAPPLVGRRNTLTFCRPHQIYISQRKPWSSAERGCARCAARDQSARSQCSG